MHVHVLENGRYAEAAQSRALPGIDLGQLAGFLDRPSTSRAIEEYRRALQQAE